MDDHTTCHIAQVRWSVWKGRMGDEPALRLLIETFAAEPKELGKLVSLRMYRCQIVVRKRNGEREDAQIVAVDAS